MAFTLKQQLSTFATIYLPAIAHREQGRDRRVLRQVPRGHQRVTAAETKAFLDKVAAEEAAPTGPAGEDGAPTVNYAQFIAEAEALLTKAGQSSPTRRSTPTEGVLDEGLYAQELITRVKAIDATFTASADRRPGRRLPVPRLPAQPGRHRARSSSSSSSRARASSTRPTRSTTSALRRSSSCSSRSSRTTSPVARRWPPARSTGSTR